MSTRNDTSIYELRRPKEAGSLVVQLSAYGLHLPEGAMVPWRTLQMVNLSFVPGTQYNDAHFLCRIYSNEGSISICADPQDAVEASRYRAFLMDLHARITYAEAKPQFTVGMRSKTGYIVLISSFAAVFVLIEGLVAYAITQRGKMGLGIGFMVGIALTGFLFLRMAVRLLQPRRYDPSNLPEEVLPK